MSDIVTGKTFVDGEKGITAAKLNQIQSLAVIQPAFYSAKPSSPTLDPTDVLLELKGTGAYAQITGSQIASSVAGQLPLADATQNGMLRQVSGNTTDVVDGTNHCVPIASMAGITQMRLRSFNALGNPTFEVDQRMTGGAISANGSTWIMDRWSSYNNTGVSPYCAPATGQSNKVPGTNFRISQGLLNYSNNSVSKTTLAAGDQLMFFSVVEGPTMRELIDDVHSISILATTNVAGGLKFAVALRDSGGTRSLVKLVTLSSPNVLTLLQFPNIPIWASGGSWSVAPGAQGYSLAICLAAGSSMIAPATDTWQNGNFLGAVGMDNILSKGATASLQVSFLQDEPGPVCTTPIDCSFTQNYDACLRYYQKTYDYAVKPGTVNINGRIVATIPAGMHPYLTVPFKKQMAKGPTITGYSPPTGTVNSVRDENAGADKTISGPQSVGESGFGGFTLASVNGAATWYDFHYTTDTGW